MVLLLAVLAFAEEPAPEPLDTEFLERIPAMREDDMEGLAAIRTWWGRVLYDESCRLTTCTTAWGEVYQRPTIPTFQASFTPAEGPRPDPLTALPTGHSVRGLLRLVRGSDPRDPTRIGGAPATFVLDGAVLNDW